VDISLSFPPRIAVLMLYDLALGWIWLDERSCALDREHLWSYSVGSSVPCSTDQWKVVECYC
jgi:hypothetical protein